ncbi:hypothetical protein SAMN05216377_11287 [Pseudonocardia oroxyli]|uniref:Uncharacterized protein n=2 Tax=Pseudonocardia oroxyli TaxID=366584 RepID=A0A1G7ULZ8_PSEOR|nr:hypothetical protein SAMN05216377_11287 [Pseudonocardia oroxyli]
MRSVESVRVVGDNIIPNSAVVELFHAEDVEIVVDTRYKPSADHRAPVVLDRTRAAALAMTLVTAIGETFDEEADGLTTTEAIALLGAIEPLSLAIEELRSQALICLRVNAPA